MRCPACAVENAEKARKCAGCGQKLPRASRAREDANRSEYYKAAAAGVAQNPPALFAYRCAMYGLIPVAGLFLGGAAFGLGLIGICRAKADPEAKGIGHAATGILLGGLEFASNLAGAIFLWIGITSMNQ